MAHLSLFLQLCATWSRMLCVFVLLAHGPVCSSTAYAPRPVRCVEISVKLATGTVNENAPPARSMPLLGFGFRDLLYRSGRVTESNTVSKFRQSHISSTCKPFEHVTAGSELSAVYVAAESVEAKCDSLDECKQLFSIIACEPNR